MRNQRPENFAVALGEHFERRKAQKIKRNQNDETGWNAEQKSFNGMVSERTEVKPAKEIAGIGTDTAGDESWEGEIARTEAFERENGGGVC